MPVKSTVKSFFFQLHTGTLPVSSWLPDKGILVAGSVNCRYCGKLETIEHIFLDCSDAVFHWDILQRTQNKELPVSAYGIRFLPTRNGGGMPHDMFMALSLRSLWKPGMAVRHADPDARPAREYFIESIDYIRDVMKMQDEQPDWAMILNELVNLKRF